MSKPYQKLLSVCLVLALMLTAVPVLAANNTFALGLSTPITFSDPNFKQALLDQGIGSNGEVTVGEAAAVTSLDVSKKNISSLDGIEYFVNLIRLDCYGNNLTVLDVSNNLALTTLNCGIYDRNSGQVFGNNLTSLDISNNTKLEYLQCRGNQLTTLDTSQNPNLRLLYCSENRYLTSLDLSNNTALEELHCSNNGITELDLTNNPSLSYLNCATSKLRLLDLSFNPELRELYCFGNPFAEGTTLDISQNTKLQRVNARNLGLIELDVSQNTRLEELYIRSNKISVLDISSNNRLTYLDCAYNQLTDLNVANGALEYLDCENNNLTTLDVTGLDALEILICRKNKLASEASVIGLDRSITTTFLFNPQDTGNIANDYNLPIKLDQKISIAKVGQTMLYEEKIYSEVQSRSGA